MAVINRVAVAVVVATIAVAGCADDDEERPASSPTTAVVDPAGKGVLETIDALQAAARRGDGATICEQLFTSTLAASVAAASGRSCPDAAKRSLFREDGAFAIERGFQVQGPTATGVIRETGGRLSEIRLRRQGGRWRIDTVTPKEAT